MNSEVEKLKKEIEELQERVDVLEKRERKRQATKLIRIIIKIILYGAILIGIWIGYNYVTNIPSMIVEKIKESNPLSSIDIGDWDFWDFFKKKGSDEE